MKLHEDYVYKREPRPLSEVGATTISEAKIALTNQFYENCDHLETIDPNDLNAHGRNMMRRLERLGNATWNGFAQLWVIEREAPVHQCRKCKVIFQHPAVVKGTYREYYGASVQTYNCDACPNCFSYSFFEVEPD